MRRIIALGISFSMVLLLVSCGAPGQTKDMPSAAVPTVSAEPAPSAEPTPAPEPSEEPEHLHIGPVSDITAKDLVAGIKSGYNFASAFDVVDWNMKRGYDTFATAALKQQFYMKENNTVPPTAEMIAPIREAGFDAIRLTVSWTLYTDNETFEIDPDWLDGVEAFVQVILDSDLYCIINCHYDYMARESSWVGDRWSDTWMAPEYQEYVDARFAAIWTQIAQRFERYDEYLLFEPMNEPTMSFDAYQAAGGEAEFSDLMTARVDGLNRIFLDAVRGSGGNNARRFVLLSGPEESVDYLDRFQVPDDERVIATVHTYFDKSPETGEPYAAWSREDADLTGRVDEAFAAIGAFTERTGVPVVVGEFGNTQALPEADRIDMASYMVEKAGSLGVPCFWWGQGWYANEPDNESFGLYDRTKMEWRWPQIAAAIVDAAHQ